MKRKVSRIGPATLMVSLPAKWVKAHNVRKGDEVEVKEDKNSLIVSKEKIGEEGKETELEIEADNLKFCERIIRSLYRKSYDKIKIRYHNPNIPKTIQDALDKLIGFVMVEQTQDYCILKNLSKDIGQDFEDIVKKLFFIAKEMANVCYHDLKNGKADNYQSILSHWKNKERFYNLCLRSISNDSFKYANKANHYYVIVVRLNLTSNRFKYIYEEMAKLKKFKASKECLDLFKRTNEMFDIYFKAYLERDFKKISEIEQYKDKLMQEAIKIFEAQKGISSVVAHYLSEVVRFNFESGVIEILGIMF